MGKLTHDGFLSEITRMLKKSKESNAGSFRMHFKRATVTSKTNPSKKEAASLSPEELCLARATLGKKKVSCTIPFKDTATFSRQMNNVLKAHIDNLKEKSAKTPKKDAKKAAAPAASPTAASSSKK